MYYNTTNQIGSTLADYRSKTETQDQLILELFQRNPLSQFTPFEVQLLLGREGVPITSVRRALTDLTNAGKLEKVEGMKMGRYNRPNHQWALAK